MIKLHTLIEEDKETKEKIKRDAFVYLEPKGDKEKFAQCATCRMFTGESCSILGKTKVTAEMSCTLYVHGKPSTGLKGKEVASYTPQEAGLVNRQVRCENCRSFSNGVCLLYQSLNKSNPDLFQLDEKVNPQGCCNAQMPRK
jgi:Pyruvate/2-oxoacid:ferredoxin oxidoreductase delta subunit